MRRIRGVVGAAALVVLLGGCWPVPGQNEDRTGENAFESTLTPANVATLTQRWAFPAAGPTGQPVLDPVASPAGIHVTSGCGLATVHPATGVMRWSATPPPPPIDAVCTGPAGVGGGRAHEPWVDGDTVYAGWEVVLLSSPGPPRPPAYAAATSGFDISTGARRSDLSGGVLHTRRGPTIGTTHGTIDAGGTVTYTDNLRHLQGDQGFAFPGGTMARSTVGSFGSAVLFTGTDGAVQAYDTGISDDGCGPGTTTACLRWATPIEGLATRPVLWGQGSKLSVATSAGKVYGLDGNQGEIEWTGTLDAPASATPALAGGVLYVPTETGQLVAFAASGCGGVPTCEPLWSASVGSSITAQPAVGGGVVYTGSSDGTLHAFAAAGCNPDNTCPALWTGETDGTDITGVIVAGGQLYAGTQAGRLYAFGLP